MDQVDRDAVAQELLRFHDEAGDGRADVIDYLTLQPELRRQVVRTLAGIDSGSD